MKYLKSLVKYLLGLIIFIGLFTGLQLILPQGQIELSTNEAIVFVIIGVIIMAVALKLHFDLR